MHHSYYFVVYSIYSFYSIVALHAPFRIVKLEAAADMRLNFFSLELLGNRFCSKGFVVKIFTGRIAISINVRFEEKS
jgi:hypothetical protein